MLKKLFKSQLSSFLVLFFSLGLPWTSCALQHQNMIAETQYAASEVSSPDYEEFMSSLEPIIAPLFPEWYDTPSHPLCSSSHQEGLDIGKPQERLDLLPSQDSDNTFHTLETSKECYQDISQLNSYISNPPVNTGKAHVECRGHERQSKNDDTEHISKLLDSPIISIPDFFTHTPDKTLSYTSNNLARHLLRKIYNYLDIGLGSVELHEAKKIWNIQTILPFVYFAISHAPSSEISSRAMRYAACLFIAYHKTFLAPHKEIDYKNLYKFFIWTTDIFHQITSPRLIIHSSMDTEHKQLQELGRMRDAHPVARLFLELRGCQKMNTSLTAFGHKHNQYFTRKFFDAWENDTQKQSMLRHSLTQLDSFWEEWNSKAEHIMAHGETLNPLMLPKIQYDQSQAQAFDGVYKCAFGFSYLVNSFLLDNTLIWGVGKEDTTSKVLSAFLNQPKASAHSNIFWHNFLNSREVFNSQNRRRTRKKGERWNRHSQRGNLPRLLPRPSGT